MGALPSMKEVCGVGNSSLCRRDHYSIKERKEGRKEVKKEKDKERKQGREE